VEAGCGWLPFVLSELKLRFKRWGRRLPDNPLEANNMFVCCQVNEDIAYVASVAGEENLMIGTDYGHNDNSAQILALRMLKDQNSLPGAVIDKILGDNPARLYGI
jgi:predicted TIM-barrel fold metal-dependent hydrolase